MEEILCKRVQKYVEVIYKENAKQTTPSTKEIQISWFVASLCDKEKRMGYFQSVKYKEESLDEKKRYKEEN